MQSCAWNLPRILCYWDPVLTLDKSWSLLPVQRALGWMGFFPLLLHQPSSHFKASTFIIAFVCSISQDICKSCFCISACVTLMVTLNRNTAIPKPHSLLHFLLSSYFYLICSLISFPPIVVWSNSHLLVCLLFVHTKTYTMLSSNLTTMSSLQLQNYTQIQFFSFMEYHRAT